MLNRVTIVYSLNIVIVIALGMIPAMLRPAFAKSPTPTAKQPCLVKYSTLSSIMCEKEVTPAVEAIAEPLAELKETVQPSPKGEPTKKAEKQDESPIREMKGIKKEYLYTDRVTKDKDGWYTKMREKTDEDSKRLEILRPGDKIRVLKKDKKGWYYAQIFKSHDPKLEGQEGWIERWLVDNVDVPKEPSPTPSPTTAPKSEVAGTNSSSTSTASAGPVSGDGETMFNMINDYRAGNGLAKFEKSERLCGIARVRAPEIAGEVATGSIHAGFRARGYGYPTAVENAVGYGNLQTNFNWWTNSSIHRASILGAELKYSCVECTNGNCVQIFSPNP